MLRLGIEAILLAVPELELIDPTNRQAERLPLRSAMQICGAKSKVPCGAFAPALMETSLY